MEQSIPEESKVPRDRYFPGLDGLRALSVVWVIVYHLSIQSNFPKSTRMWRILDGVFLRGSAGVQIFFVLSGFLITWLMILEEKKTQTIHLGNFYARRALRILPPAFMYLLWARALGMLGWIPVTWSDVAKAAFFVANIFAPHSGETQHYWSLAVEEQFYFVWPFFLILFRGNCRLILTAALIVAAPIFQWEYIHIHGIPPVMRRSDLIYDMLLYGCLLALLRGHQRFAPILRGSFFQNPAMLAAAIGGLVFAQLPQVLHGRYAPIYNPSLMGASMAVGINFLIEGHRTPVDWGLNLEPVAWIGKLSYSLYLWQQLFCQGRPGLWMCGFPQNVVLTAICAAASYYLMETPLQRLRSRLHAQSVQPNVAMPATVDAGPLAGSSPEQT